MIAGAGLMRPRPEDVGSRQPYPIVTAGPWLVSGAFAAPLQRDPLHTAHDIATRPMRKNLSGQWRHV
jgi:hypothetical protein